MPETLENFKRQFPDVWTDYEELRDVCDTHGPLDTRTVELIKTAVSCAMGHEGGVIAHVAQAKKAGASPEEIYQALLVTVPLAGFPTVLASVTAARKYLES